MNNPANRESDIFNAALERATAAERDAFLDGACGEDAGLRIRVAALLSAHDLAGGFLPMDNPKPQPPAITNILGITSGMLPVAEQPGNLIGRYKLREKLGEGGCGVVYVAEQEQPVRRRVALKVIKLGMDTRAVIARFESERQALAMMDHPNIAKVLDAGATTTGRPYFVMELVRGIKITEYCDQNALSTRDRLELFIKVCQAIQHAHQKGIIHRDIKPSNILVTLHDGEPVPKIIDFGIAKATEGRLSDLTVYTDLHQFIGTPAYVSPEQAEMSGLDIDTRADIYSLGVLLYELLTGRTPFDAQALLQSGLDAMRRTIRETEPVRPSTRLSAMLQVELTAVAERHCVEPPRLVNLVRGDLDWIVMKALEKDRSRRYETANDLATDIHRHLSNEPIAARPQSAAYQFYKLVRRNRLAFAAAGTVAAVLVLGLAGIFWQWRQAERNHQEAEANLYASDMNRAAQELDDLGPVAARGLLERHAGQTQLQGFEWRYLWKRCLGDFAYSFPSHSNRVWKLVFSPNGKTLAALEEHGALRLLDLSARSEEICLTNAAGLAGFTRDGQELVVSLRQENTTHLACYELKSGSIIGPHPDASRLGWLPDLLRDGSTAVIAGPETELSLVDIRTGDVTAQIRLPCPIFGRWQAMGEAGEVSNDGRWVFSLDNIEEDGTVGRLSVREVASGKILATYLDDAPGTPKTGMVDRFYVLRFLRDGATAIWATRDGFIRRWRWTDPGSRLLTQSGHRGIVWDIDCTLDGQRFATAGDDQTVRVWNANDLGEVRVLRGHTAPVYTVAFSPDGHWLASGGEDGTVKLWDLSAAEESGEVPLLAARHLANRLAFSPDGRSLALGTDDDGVAVVGVESGKETHSFKALSFPARFSTDATRIIAFGGVGDLVTGKIDHSIEFPYIAYPWAHDCSPDGRLLIRSFLYPTNQAAATELLDVQRGTVITNFIPKSMVIAVRFTDDGRTILASHNDGVLDWWTVTPKGLTPRRSLQVGHKSRAMAISPDGLTVALGGFSRISLVDFRTGAIRQRFFGHGHEINGVAFSPDGGTLASCSMDGKIKLWSLRTLQEVCTIPFDIKPALGKELGVQGVGFAPDDNSLWAFSRSGVLKYWRAATTNEIVTAEPANKP